VIRTAVAVAAAFAAEGAQGDRVTLTPDVDVLK
jgi:hypothetical protein